MCAFEEMMRKNIVMPAHLMDDNEHLHITGRNLFADFSEVAQVSGLPSLCRLQLSSVYSLGCGFACQHWTLLPTSVPSG